MSTLASALTVLIVVFSGLLVYATLRWWNETHSPLATKTRRRIAASLQPIESTAPLLGGGVRELPDKSSRRIRLPFSRLIRYSEEAGLGKYLERWIAAAFLWWLLVASLMWWWDAPVFLRILLALILALAPLGILARRHDQIDRAMEKQIPEALDVMARTLQAGKALPACWREMGEVLDKPLAPICRDIHLKLQYGGELEEVLRETSRRIPSDDLRFFFVSLIIQTRSGGNLIALLQDQSQLIRERIAMRERIRALSGEGRLSAWLMGLMPFFVTGLMMLINPETMSLLWRQPTGLVLMQIGLLLQALGALWIIKLVRIRV